MTTAFNKLSKQFMIGNTIDRFLLFRIVLGMLMLFKVTSLSPHWLDLYGEAGFFPREVVEVSGNPLIPYFSISDIFVQLLGVSADQASFLLMYLMMACSAFLILGLLSRLSAIVLLILNVSLTASFGDYVYGVDYFLSSLLFYSVFFPLGQRYSLDHLIEQKLNLRTKFSRLRIRENEAQLILGIHLSIVYLVGGLTKASGPTWWNGGAIWTALHRPDLEWSMVMMEYLDLKFVYVALGISTIFVELLYPVMIWFRRTRAIWLILTLGMHLFIGVVMELHLFASVMVFFNLVAFGGQYQPFRFGEKKTELPPLAA